MKKYRAVIIWCLLLFCVSILPINQVTITDEYNVEKNKLYEDACDGDLPYEY